MGQGKESEVATLAGGCFWCLEAVFQQLRGVQRVESGYSGGDSENPTYHQVTTGDTGHAEAVNITYEPGVITFRELLLVFFATHNPTTLNRQGPDVGSQYRSAIFYHGDEQKRAAEELVGELTEDEVFEKPVVTEIAPFTAFYRAEDYHQDYYLRNREQPYCQAIISPKLAKLRDLFSDKLKDGARDL